MNKNSVTGFTISVLLHSLIAIPLFLNSFEISKPQLETMQITINNFIVSDNAGQNLEPDDAPMIEDRLTEEFFETLKDEIVEEIVEEIIEPQVEEIVQTPAPKPKKPEPKKKPKKNIDKNITKVADTKQAQPTNTPQTIAPSQADGLSGAVASSAGSDYLTTQGEAVESDIKGKIHSIVSAYAKRHYPSAAVRRKQTGTVRISFRYCRNGHVERLRVNSSSGHETLDEAVKEAIEKTKKKFPHTDRDLEMEFPVRFVLN